jgi:hypothetical protein
LAQTGSHGQGHQENHDWYKELKQPGTTYSCCNDEDCRPTRAYIDDEGNWKADIGGRWVTVPWARVLNQQAPDGRSHICADKNFGTIFCFIGGSPKS